jgi:hypothetical protein
MRIRATCEHCGREFLLVQLYTAGSFHADRCPHCSAHLGVVRAAPLTAAAEESLATLGRSPREIAARNPRFRLDPESVLAPVTEALEAAAQAGPAATSGPSRAA